MNQNDSSSQLCDMKQGDNVYSKALSRRIERYALILSKDCDEKRKGKFPTAATKKADLADEFCLMKYVIALFIVWHYADQPFPYATVTQAAQPVPKLPRPEDIPTAEAKSCRRFIDLMQIESAGPEGTASSQYYL